MCRRIDRSRVPTALLATLLGLGALSAANAQTLTLAWTNNMLTVRGANLPKDGVKIWYLEAFCRSGSTDREWSETTLPHQTRLLDAAPDGSLLRLVTDVEPSVRMIHSLRAGRDEVDFAVAVENRGEARADVQWFQPCMRVDGFMDRTQEDYWRRCFIYTERGLTFLADTRRTEEARYRGGQVYVPAGIDLADVNPRPISPDRPVNGLIGCVSGDGRYLLATAWDRTQELFQGVIVCIHNDPRIGGLEPGETKRLRGKLYVLENDPETLLRRYTRDFP